MAMLSYNDKIIHIDYCFLGIESVMDDSNFKKIL